MNIEAFLKPEEKVLWKGSQSYKSLLVDSLFVFVILAGFGVVFYFLGGSGMECEVNGVVATEQSCSRWTNIFSFVFVFFGLWSLKPFLKKGSDVDHYAITDRKIILIDKFSAFKGRTISYRDIKNLNLKKGLITNTAQIQIDTGKTRKGRYGSTVKEFDIMFGIEKPEEVFEILQNAKNSTS